MGLGVKNVVHTDEELKTLVKELTQTFYAVADDVFMNIRFNPAMVKEYRLIGFDNKKEALADSTWDLEGGEIGSGSSVMALFEILPTEKNLFDIENRLTGDSIACLSMRYSMCEDTAHMIIEHQCPANYKPSMLIDKDLQFAAALSMFSLKLKNSKYINDIDWEQVEQIALAAADPANYLQNGFLQMVSKAKKIYALKKKKRRNF